MKALATLTLALVTVVSVQSHAWFGEPETQNQYSVPGALITESSQEVIITIDGNEVNSLAQLHEIMATALKLPNTYGKNFDALYDVLTDVGLVGKHIDIGVIGGEALKLKIGAKNHKTLLKVLNDAQEADPMHVSSIYWQ